MPGLASMPDSLRQQVGEAFPTGKYPKELAILFDDTIEARPLNLPGIGQLSFKNTEVVYHWVRRPMGPNPDLTRYMQLKTAGFRNATLEDVDPLVNSVNADHTEITCGQDLILMCASPAVYYGAIKSHMLRAIRMTNPKSAESRQVQMKSANYGDNRALEATRSEYMDEKSIGDFEQRSNSDNTIRQGTPEWDKIVEGAKKKRS